jgi:hypothetical protein
MEDDRKIPGRSGVLALVGDPRSIANSDYVVLV